MIILHVSNYFRCSFIPEGHRNDVGTNIDDKDSLHILYTSLVFYHASLSLGRYKNIRLIACPCDLYPLHQLLHSETGVYRGIHFFLFLL